MSHNSSIKLKHIVELNSIFIFTQKKIENNKSCQYNQVFQFN